MTKMEEDQNERRPKWKTTKMEGDQNRRRPKLKMQRARKLTPISTSTGRMNMKDDQNERQPK